MFDLIGVSKSYKIKGVRKNVLDDVSFSFPKDRNVAIMGPNGVGKSTLMRMLAGIEAPDRGRIHRSVQVSWPMGFSGGFNGLMTGLENVRFVARLYGADTEAVIDYVETFAQLGASFRLPIQSYSNGMKSRLALGLSLAVDFDCYLIDEITEVGDRAFRARSKRAFEEKLSRANVVVVSHSASTIRDYCECGVLIRDRSLIYYDAIEDLIGAYEADPQA